MRLESKMRIRRIVQLCIVMLCVLVLPLYGVAAPIFVEMYAEGNISNALGGISGSRGNTTASAFANSVYSYGAEISTSRIPGSNDGSFLGLAYSYIGENYFIQIPNATAGQVSHFKGHFTLIGSFENIINSDVDIYPFRESWRAVWSVAVGAHNGSGINLDPAIGCKGDFSSSMVFTPSDGSAFVKVVPFDIEILGSYARVPIVGEITLYNFGGFGTAKFYDPVEFYIDYSELPLGTTITTGSGGPPVPDSAPAPVPEPSTLILLGAGLAGVGFLRKGRRDGKGHVV